MLHIHNLPDYVYNFLVIRILRPILFNRIIKINYRNLTRQKRSQFIIIFIY